jgi:hypothetical protein
MNGRTGIALGVAGLAAVIAVVAGMLRHVGVKSYGGPAGRVVRTGEHLAVLMQTRDPYMPSLKGRAERDMSYSYALWIFPQSGDGEARITRLARGVRSGDRSSFAGVLGSVGGTVWLRITYLQGVDLASGQGVSAPAPPSIANMPISDFLRPNDTPTLGPYRTTAVSLPSGAWLVLADEEEAPTELKLGTPLHHNSTSKGTYRDRALYAVSVQPGPIARLASATRLPTAGLNNAAFMRGAANGEVIRFSNPDGFLVAYEARATAERTIHFARVNVDGSVAWTADTRMGQLDEVLPHGRYPTFVGQLENHLSEPMLAVLDLESGQIRRHSLKGPL